MSSDTLQRLQTKDERLSIQADRLIIATNRGPVEYFVTRDKTLKFRRGSGVSIASSQPKILCKASRPYNQEENI